MIEGTGQTLTDALLSPPSREGLISDTFGVGGRGLKRREANLRGKGLIQLSKVGISSS